MLDADKARALDCVRTGTGVAIAALAAAMAGVAPSHAETAKGEGRGPAPIIYASSALSTIGPSVGSLPGAAVSVPFSNGLASKPSASAAAPFDVFQGQTGQAQPAPSDVINLRPGALKASFGPAVATTERLEAMPRALTSRPLPEITNPAAFAKPYAGPPYQVEGKWFVPTHEPNYDETGTASWYGPTFHGKASASGEVFDQDALTAAHPTLPIPSLVRVTNMENGKTVLVRLNDRGPFVDDRIIDLSRRAAEVLEMRGKGTAKVRVQYVGPAPAEANTLPASSMDMAVSEQPAQPAFSVQPLAPMAMPSPVAEVRPAAVETGGQAGLVQSDDELRGFYLQVGSFADLGNAHKLRAKLQASGPAFVNPAFVTAAQINGSEFYRVMLGPWDARVDAERAQDGIARAGGKAIVVARLDN